MQIPAQRKVSSAAPNFGFVDAADPVRRQLDLPVECYSCMRELERQVLLWTVFANGFYALDQTEPILTVDMVRPYVPAIPPIFAASILPLRDSLAQSPFFIDMEQFYSAGLSLRGPILTALDSEHYLRGHDLILLRPMIANITAIARRIIAVTRTIEDPNAGPGRFEFLAELEAELQRVSARSGSLIMPGQLVMPSWANVRHQARRAINAHGRHKIGALWTPCFIKDVSESAVAVTGDLRHTLNKSVVVRFPAGRELSGTVTEIRPTNTALVKLDQPLSPTDPLLFG